MKSTGEEGDVERLYNQPHVPFLALCNLNGDITQGEVIQDADDPDSFLADLTVVVPYPVKYVKTTFTL